MAVEMVGETTGWSGRGFNLYFCFEESQTVRRYERQFSWRVILYTKPLTIALLQPDNPTACKTVIECLYWNPAPERISNQNFQLLYLCYDVYLVELCSLCRDGLTVPSNSSSFEVPHAAFWSVFVTWGMVKEFSSTLILRQFTMLLTTATAQSTIPNITELSASRRSVMQCHFMPVSRRSKSDVAEPAVHGSWSSVILRGFTGVKSVTSGLSQRCGWRRVTGWRLPTFRSNALPLF
jgi:hypothetical protein